MNKQEKLQRFVAETEKVTGKPFMEEPQAKEEKPQTKEVKKKSK